MSAANRMGAGNYIQAGKAATRNMLGTIAAARDNAPKYDEIAMEGLKARAEEKVVAIRAKTAVAEAGIKAEAKIRKTKENINTDKAILKGRQGVAKAGVVAAAGQLIGDAFKKEREPYKPNFEAYMEYYNKREQALDKKAAEINDPNNTFGLTRPTPGPTMAGGSSTDTVGGSSGGSTGGSSTGSGGSGSAPTGIRGDVYTYLTTDKGLSRNHALGLMANIDRESGFNPSIRSGDDGGPGGLFQWKGGRQTSTVASLVDAGDWKGQIDYALSEPEHLSAVTPGSFQATQFNSPQEAADWWMTKWERPADTVSGSKKHSQFISGYNF